MNSVPEITARLSEANIATHYKVMEYNAQIIPRTMNIEGCPFRDLSAELMSACPEIEANLRSHKSTCNLNKEE